MIKMNTGVRVNRLGSAPMPTRVRTASKTSKGLKFERVFSSESVSPFDQIEWDRRTAKITDDSGKVIFEQQNVEVPMTWSALATKIAVSKYFYGDIAHGSDPWKGGREA